MNTKYQYPAALCRKQIGDGASTVVEIKTALADAGADVPISLTAA
jgi:hypothetical protein